MSMLILFSCSEKESDLTVIHEESDDQQLLIHVYDQENVITPPHPEVIHTSYYAELSQLRQQFQGNLFDDNFIILRFLTSSQNYIAYLNKTFSRDKHHDTLDEFWKLQPPDTNQIRLLFDELVENPNDKQITFVHYGILAMQCSTLDTLITIRLQDKCSVNRFSTKQSLKLSPAHQNTIYFAHHQSLWDLATDEQWGDPWIEELQDRYQRYADETVHIYSKKIRGFFSEYGVNNGLLWLAIQDPDLIGFVLSNITDENAFWCWINHL